MLSAWVLAAAILNPSSSFEREISLESCRHAEVKKVCNLVVEAPGYGSKKYRLYKREQNGDLLMLETGALDVAGNKTFRLKFDSVGTANLLLMLFSTKGKPLAIDGAFIVVQPESSQLGEQYIPSLNLEVITPAGESEEEETAEEDYGPPDGT